MRKTRNVILLPMLLIGLSSLSSCSLSKDAVIKGENTELRDQVRHEGRKEGRNLRQALRHKGRLAGQINDAAQSF